MCPGGSVLYFHFIDHLAWPWNPQTAQHVKVGKAKLEDPRNHDRVIRARKRARSAAREAVPVPGEGRSSVMVVLVRSAALARRLGICFPP